MSTPLQRVRPGNKPMPPASLLRGRLWWVAGTVLLLAVPVPAWKAIRGARQPAGALRAQASSGPGEAREGASPARPPATSPSARAAASVVLTTNEVAHALMVTVELDFGKRVPGIEEALKEVERQYGPADGGGRTFAILDAYGETTPAGKLHMSMHVSMEKPGTGALVFRRTGEVLWRSQIVPSRTPGSAGKDLTILMEDAAGHPRMLDGSKGAGWVLDVPLRETGTRVRDDWPDGTEREFTFIYSACGCPVKAKVQRAGEGTRRSGGLPVMFPDDPEAMQVIRQLMGWPGN